MKAVSYFRRSSITPAPTLLLIHHDERIGLPVLHDCLIPTGGEKHPVWETQLISKLCILLFVTSLCSLRPSGDAFTGPEQIPS